ncbi:MAG: LEA type 2 family protein [Archangium sp.]
MLKRVLLITSVAALLPGCAYLADFLKSAQGAGLFNQPTFTFKTANLENITLGGLDLDTVWTLDNPNDVGISLASIDYALFIEDKQVVAGTPKNGLEIGARGASTLHFPANIKFQDVAQVVEVFLSKDRAKWKAEGSLGVQTPIGVIKLPLAKEDTFEVPKIPAVVFQNPKVTNINLTGATIEFPMQVTSKNTYAIPLGVISGNLAIAGSNVGTVSTPALGDVTGTKVVSVPVNVNFISAAGAVVNAVRGGNAQVTFNAQMQSGQQQVPIKVDQLLSFTR